MYEQMKPVPFDSHHDAVLLSALGFVATYHAASWEDVGGPESGPELAGGPAWVEWACDNHYLIVCEGMIVDAGEVQEPPDYND